MSPAGTACSAVPSSQSNGAGPTPSELCLAAPMSKSGSSDDAVNLDADNVNDADNVISLLTDEDDDKVESDPFVRNHFTDVCKYNLSCISRSCYLKLCLITVL